jgi:hypothetical protein
MKSFTRTLSRISTYLISNHFEMTNSTLYERVPDARTNGSSVVALTFLSALQRVFHKNVKPIFYNWSGRTWRKALILLELRGHFCENVVPRL